MDGGSITSIVVLALLILMSAYFSASETAFSTFNRIRMKNLAEGGNKRAASALRLSEDYNTLLSTILVGNNIVNIAATSIPADIGELLAQLSSYDAVIVDAGFAGIGAAIQLKRSGFENFVILDREDDLGGTWHVNHYPGLAVDIASVTYSYSFAPNPHWSRLFAPGAELKKYAEHIADEYDLRRHMEFGTAVERAEWDDDDRLWTVHTADGSSRTTRYQHGRRAT
mgnify:CR=1 FL=1